MIPPAKALPTDALDYRTYCLANRDQTCIHRIAQRISRMRRSLYVQMRDQLIDGCDHISILSFFKTLKTAYGSNEILEGAAI